MIDIGPNIDVASLGSAAFQLGWPGLLIGAALGVWAWRERRAFGGSVGALLGTSAWAAVNVVMF